MGSAIGGVARYLLSQWLNPRWSALPLGTMVVNVVGCLLIGLISGALARSGAQVGEGWRLFLTVGLCGGFTTFSTFMNENYTMLTLSAVLPAILYTALSLILGLLAVYLGYRLTT